MSSAVLTAIRPDGLAVYDRNANEGLKRVALALADDEPHHYAEYMRRIEQCRAEAGRCEAISGLHTRWTSRYTSWARCRRSLANAAIHARVHLVRAFRLSRASPSNWSDRSQSALGTRVAVCDRCPRSRRYPQVTAAGACCSGSRLTRHLNKARARGRVVSGDATPALNGRAVRHEDRQGRLRAAAERAVNHAQRPGRAARRAHRGGGWRRGLLRAHLDYARPGDSHQRGHRAARRSVVERHLPPQASDGRRQDPPAHRLRPARTTP